MKLTPEKWENKVQKFRRSSTLKGLPSFQMDISVKTVVQKEGERRWTEDFFQGWMISNVLSGLTEFLLKNEWVGLHTCNRGKLLHVNQGGENWNGSTNLWWYLLHGGIF